MMKDEEEDTYIAQLTKKRYKRIVLDINLQKIRSILEISQCVKRQIRLFKEKQIEGVVVSVWI